MPGAWGTFLCRHLQRYVHWAPSALWLPVGHNVHNLSEACLVTAGRTAPEWAENPQVTTHLSSLCCCFRVWKEFNLCLKVSQEHIWTFFTWTKTKDRSGAWEELPSCVSAHCLRRALSHPDSACTCGALYPPGAGAPREWGQRLQPQQIGYICSRTQGGLD